MSSCSCFSNLQETNWWKSKKKKRVYSIIWFRIYQASLRYNAWQISCNSYHHFEFLASWIGFEIQVKTFFLNKSQHIGPACVRNCLCEEWKRWNMEAQNSSNIDGDDTTLRQIITKYSHFLYKSVCCFGLLQANDSFPLLHHLFSLPLSPRSVVGWWLVFSFLLAKFCWLIFIIH